MKPPGERFHATERLVLLLGNNSTNLSVPGLGLALSPIRLFQSPYLLSCLGEWPYQATPRIHSS